MNTEQIIQSELDSFVDAFYSYLIKEGNGKILPEELKKLFCGIEIENISFILDGLEEKYFADYTYFRSETYEDEIYCSIPFGEIEIEKEYIDENCLDDFFCNDDGLCYHDIPAITIVYNQNKVIDAICDYFEE